MAWLLARLAFIVVFSVRVFLALGVLGLDKTVTSLMAGAGVIGLALGFAAQKLAANVMSGVLIATRRPFHIGDWIQSDDLEGRVERVDLNVCTLLSTDGRTICVPNSTLLDAPLTNLSRTGRRRIDLVVGCSHGDDVAQALDVTRQALQDVPGRLEQHEVEVQATGFGNSSVDLVARVWCRWQAPRDSFEARSAMVTRIHRDWGEAGLTIPFPIRTLDFGIVGGRALSEEAVEIRAPRLRALAGGLAEQEDPAMDGESSTQEAS